MIILRWYFRAFMREISLLMWKVLFSMVGLVVCLHMHGEVRRFGTVSCRINLWLMWCKIYRDESWFEKVAKSLLPFQKNEVARCETSVSTVVLTDFNETKSAACLWNQSDWSCVSSDIQLSACPAKPDSETCYSRLQSSVSSVLLSRVSFGADVWYWYSNSVICLSVMFQCSMETA